jgi:hypothetical protein
MKIEYKREDLNKLNPCCLTCEYVGELKSFGNKAIASCQLGVHITDECTAFVCPKWDINMDIDEGEDDDVVLETVA